MALPARQEQKPQLHDFAKLLPDDVKTKIIICANPSHSLYPAICVHRACRDTLWADPRRLYIRVPVDLKHSQSNSIARGAVRAIKQRAELRKELQEQAQHAGGSYSVHLAFTSSGNQAAAAASSQDLQTARIGLMLHSMEASSRDLITHLSAVTDFDGKELRLPTLPSLTYLRLKTAGGTIPREFFSALDLPQLQYLQVSVPHSIPVQHVLPVDAARLQQLYVCPEYDVGSMLVSDMPQMPALTKLHTCVRLTLAELISLTTGPLPNLEELMVDELLPSQDMANMPVTAAGDRLGALQRVKVTGHRLPLSLAASLHSRFGLHVYVVDPYPSAGLERSWPVTLYVGQQDAGLDPASPLVDEQIAEVDSVILPGLIVGPVMWDTACVGFPRHLVSHMIQVLAPKGLLPSVQLSPPNAQELIVQLRQLRFSTPSTVPVRVRIVTTVPQLRVAELFAQCWPGFPQDNWRVFYPQGAL